MIIRFAILTTYLATFSATFAEVKGIRRGAEDGIPFFENEIRPILHEFCLECHSSETKGGLRLDSRIGIEAGGDSGAAIVKGDPKASLLIEAIRYGNRDLQMPPKNPLPEDKIAKLEKWITMGAPDPRNEATEIAAKPRGMSIKEGRRFWSFQPVTRPPVPALESPFIHTPIDAFIQQNLKENQLSSAPPANKQTLIRRVTQNLTGLPPTEAEITSFLSDSSPQAFENVVERLLDSPHYGVRWARHWLDVARYADSNGLDENIGFGHAWRYRDYVVESFNADKPYDQFLIEQIAGDLVPNANRETITGTCFLQLGPKVMAEPDIEKLNLDVIDEQLDTLGKTFMGMTLGCVRCHDHKFDPIKQTDYYSLAAIFKGTKTFGGENMGAIKFWYEHSIATEKDKERIKKADEQLKKLNAAASSFKNRKLAKIQSDARAHAADYLVACTKFDLSTPLTEVATFAASFNLHARILHHCRRHLEFRRDDPFFTDWHRFKADGQIAQLRQHYHDVFTESETALATARKDNNKITSLSDKRLETARAALYDKAGFLAVPNVDSFALDEDSLAEHYRLLNIARAFESTAPDPPALMGVGEGEITKTMPMFIRGDHKRPGKKVTRGFPKVMHWNAKAPALSENSSGRLELAKWMADPRHPLTARVMVNRLWTWHFGQGLVSSTENFGVMGDKPSNPQLLDWLADYFVTSGWSIKAMHRIILRSSTWQMASQHPNEASYSKMDPENRLHWKQNLRRLEAEQIRDSILAVSGRLDHQLGGKTLPLRNRQFVFNHTSEDHTTYDSLRRALYLPIIRNNLYPLFEQFDFPDPTMPTGTRHETVIAPQALVMLNDPLILDSAQAMARNILRQYATPDERIRAVYLQTLGRLPRSIESERDTRLLKALSTRTTEEQTWMLYCQSLFASNGFVYVK
ncbi:PSD1 and planctomycete cytochrome C domain-containing protein [Verrucomicrobia bacterium]|nr:PSD1 and planctomycete cytochrome C domain-containing protein [Verrucomicrobiota bacterium]